MGSNARLRGQRSKSRLLLARVRCAERQSEEQANVQTGKEKQKHVGRLFKPREDSHTGLLGDSETRDETSTPKYTRK